MRSDEVEKHFNAPRALDNRFRQALEKSEFRTQSEFFRFHMKQFANDSESKDKVHREESKTKKKHWLGQNDDDTIFRREKKSQPEQDKEARNDG